MIDYPFLWFANSGNGISVKRIDPKPLWEEKWWYDLVDISHAPHDHHMKYEVTVHKTLASLVGLMHNQLSFLQSNFWP